MKKVADLVSKGITDEVISQWAAAGITELLPIQELAIERGVLERQSLLVVAPTSSGKTFIGEMAAISHALKGLRTVYLVPFKAIAEEKYLDFVDKYGGPDIGFSIVISDKDHRANDDDVFVGNYDILIITYEKLSALLVLSPGILDGCACVVVDEIQMISDESRGGNLELLLTKEMTQNKRFT